MAKTIIRLRNFEHFTQHFSPYLIAFGYRVNAVYKQYTRFTAFNEPWFKCKHEFSRKPSRKFYLALCYYFLITNRVLTAFPSYSHTVYNNLIREYSVDYIIDVWQLYSRQKASNKTHYSTQSLNQILSYGTLETTNRYPVSLPLHVP